jgi:hypothetical protein
VTGQDQRNQSTNGVDPELGPTLRQRGAGGRPGPFDLNDRQKLILVLVLVVHVILARITLRDLRGRPESTVRGPKLLWRVWATMNTTGSLGYWLVGRRREPAA